MSLREQLLNSAVVQLQQTLIERTGRDCHAVTATVRAFTAMARDSKRNPFELIPVFVIQFDANYGKTLRLRKLWQRLPK